MTLTFCFSSPRSEGWPHHGRTFSIYLCPLSFWLTLPRRVLSTSWCYPSKPCVVFLVCVHITFTFCCCNLWKSKLIALKKPGKLTEFFFNYNCGHTYVLNGGTYPPAGSNCGLSSGPLLKIRDIQCAVDVLGLIWKVAAAMIPFALITAATFYKCIGLRTKTW